MLGTNPIAFAAPAERNAPFLLDMATSAASLGKLRRRVAAGPAMPTRLGGRRDAARRHERASRLQGAPADAARRRARDWGATRATASRRWSRSCRRSYRDARVARGAGSRNDPSGTSSSRSTLAASAATTSSAPTSTRCWTRCARRGPSMPASRCWWRAIRSTQPRPSASAGIPLTRSVVEDLRARRARRPACRFVLDAPPMIRPPRRRRLHGSASSWRTLRGQRRVPFLAARAARGAARPARPANGRARGRGRCRTTASWFAREGIDPREIRERRRSRRLPRARPGARARASPQRFVADAAAARGRSRSSPAAPPARRSRSSTTGARCSSTSRSASASELR